MRRGSEEFRESLADSLDFQATGIGASRRCKWSLGQILEGLKYH